MRGWGGITAIGNNGGGKRDAGAASPPETVGGGLTLALFKHLRPKLVTDLLEVHQAHHQALEGDLLLQQQAFEEVFEPVDELGVQRAVLGSCAWIDTPGKVLSDASDAEVD